MDNSTAQHELNGEEGPPNKRARTTENGDVSFSPKSNVATMDSLQEEIQDVRQNEAAYYTSSDCVRHLMLHDTIPEKGMSARHVQERIVQNQELDNRVRLNTSSYVNVVMEPEEKDVALRGLKVNLADASVYPASVRLHDTVVNMIAQMWNCPKPTGEDAINAGNYSGAGTVGSTEACLLAGLALKFRWRKWYQTKYNKTHEEVMCVPPNMVISSCYQAAWEKFFRYFDVTARFVKPSLENKMRIDPKQLVDLCDERTIGVVGILGNHVSALFPCFS